jgi:hypothetical protein
LFRNNDKYLPAYESSTIKVEAACSSEKISKCIPEYTGSQPNTIHRQKDIKILFLVSRYISTFIIRSFFSCLYFASELY